MNSNTAVQQSKGKNSGKADAGNGISDVLAGTAETQAFVEKKVVAFKDTVSDNLAGAAEKLHQKSDVAQDYLNVKSDQLNSYAHNAVEKANHLGHKTADAFEVSSDYLKNFDVSEARQQIREKLTHRPEITIAVAGFFGLAIGLLIGRRFK